MKRTDKNILPFSAQHESILDPHIKQIQNLKPWVKS
jgi:hypothetical protein